MTQSQITKNEPAHKGAVEADRAGRITTDEEKVIMPFLQWVGGKRKIVDRLLAKMPAGLDNYYEPFLGGGALFFQVQDKFKQCFLSDINLDLTTTYNAVKRDLPKIIALCQLHKQRHSKEYYFQVRNNQAASNDPAEITARFLYLNRYSFRGIYRLTIATCRKCPILLETMLVWIILSLLLPSVA